MAEAANAARNNGPQDAVPPLFEQVLRMFAIFFAIQYFMQSTQVSPKNNDSSASGGDPKRMPTKPGTSSCVWPRESLLSLSILVTQDELAKNSVLAEWHQDQIQCSNASLLRADNLTLVVPKETINNETHLYAHIVLSKQGDRENVMTKAIPLTKHKKRKRIRDEKNLLETNRALSSSDEAVTQETANNDQSPLTKASLNHTHDQTLLYLKPSLTLQLVDLTMTLPERNRVPPQMDDFMDWVDNSTYYPVLYPSEFWITKDRLVEINGTLQDEEIQLEVRLEAAPMWKWQLMSGMENQWKVNENLTGEEDVTADTLRTMLLETSPYLLVLTAIVSVLHTVFDVLAFKNDIAFFRGSKSMEGLSIRTMLVNTFFQAVILLYLADNETSYMILLSNGVGLAIEVWKITKAVTISFKEGKFQWEETSTYTKTKTKEYDEIATTHLLFVTMPLVTGYGLYALYYQKHKSWYSWVLNTMVGFIYMFGFVMMTPQLFINYKLQSVAHLNWRTMTYKSINTFIDDLFAFVIKMPLMHRLACLRDDVIFLIFLYQRWVYRTDYTRVNEYGQCSQPTEEMLKEAAAEKARKNAAARATEPTMTQKTKDSNDDMAKID